MNGNILVTHQCDGANWKVNKNEDDIPVTCFNLHVFSNDVKKKFCSGSSYCLLTFLMVGAPEKPQNIFPCIENIYKEFKEVESSNETIIPQCKIHL